MVPKRIAPVEQGWEPAAWRAVPREFRCVRAGAGTRTITGGEGAHRSTDFTDTVLRSLCNSELPIKRVTSL